MHACQCMQFRDNKIYMCVCGYLSHQILSHERIRHVLDDPLGNPLAISFTMTVFPLVALMAFPRLLTGFVDLLPKLCFYLKMRTFYRWWTSQKSRSYRVRVRDSIEILKTTNGSPQLFASPTRDERPLLSAVLKWHPGCSTTSCPRSTAPRAFCWSPRISSGRAKRSRALLEEVFESRTVVKTQR